MRIRFIKRIVFFTVIIHVLCAPVFANGHKNVLLICIDDLRNVLGCYGGKAKTPHLDALAKRGTAFKRHYVQWPVCGPSRASMLSSLRPDTTGIYEIKASWKIAKKPSTQPTLPLTFKNHGYNTLSFGKVFHGKGASDGYGWSQTPWKLDWTCYVNFKPSKTKHNWRPAVEIYNGPDAMHNDYKTTNKVITALEENKNNPFFIATGFFKPHLPFVAPKKYWDLYSEDEIKRLSPTMLPEGAANFMFRWSEIHSYGLKEGQLFENEQSISREHARTMIHAYYACVSFIDAQVGRLLKAIDKKGLTESTAVVVWSDHGFHLGDHGRWAKHTQFEKAMNSPLIVRLPGYQVRTGISKAIVESIDIYPTLCEYAGINIPKSVEGKSFLPTIKGDSFGKKTAFSQIRPVNKKKYNLMAYSIRTKYYRYIEWREPEKNNQVIWEELYDHRRDPSGNINVAENSKYKKVVERHQKMILSQYKSLK